MAIIFGSDTSTPRQNSFGQVLGFLDQQYQSTKNGLINAFTLNSTRPSPPPKENVYVDGGFEGVPGTAFVGSSIDNVSDIKKRNITTQEPSITAYIHKRAFRSLRGDNDLKFLDRGEILFLRATKILFENKCQQIAAYEALTKAQRLIDEESDLDYNRIGAIIDVLQNNYLNNINNLTSSAIESATQGLASGNSVASQQAAFTRANDIIALAKKDSEYFESLLVGLQELQVKSDNLRNATNTTWVVDSTQPDVFLVGRGSGVIELTLVSDLNTSLLLDGSVGSIGFTFQDPYNLSKITTDEIEVALGVAKKELGNALTSAPATSPQFDLQHAQRLEQDLKNKRKNRIANAFGLGQNSGNAVLSGTDNTEIVFEVDLSSDSQFNVKASIGDGPAFGPTNFLSYTLQLPPEQQLTTVEISLITSIFDSLSKYVMGVQNLNKNYAADNNDNDVKYARRNLRLHYLGKSIVQPMDTVNVYMRSNTFKQNSIIGPLSSLINNSLFIKNFVTNNNKLSDVELEEEMKVFGLDDLGIPVDIYRSLRTDSLMRNGGTHVFGGIVTSVTEDYNADAGVYTTKISGASNMQWLAQSRVNVSPSLDQTQGLLEDPLTAFDIVTDPGTGLIVQQPQLNSQNQDRINNDLINYNSGSYLGKKFTTDNYAQDYLTNGDGTSTPQYKHAPGLVYKWKQGILVATRNVNLKTSVGDQEDQTQKAQREIGVNVVNDPFVGQDAANIVSILVTGYPHNYESFYENSKSVGTFSSNAQSNSPESYFHSFFDINRSQNRALGNFQPFKTSILSPAMVSKRLGAQQYLVQKSGQLAQLRGDLANLQDQLNAINTSSAQNDSQSVFGELLKSRIDALTIQINTLSSATKSTANQSQNTLKIYGTDWAYDFGGSTAESEKQNMDEKFKRNSTRNSLLQLRPQYDCKMNTDTNLFVVAEEYDKDLDIEAFVINMSQNISLWESQYKTPQEICSLTAKTIDFEFYCDSMGHIQFRPPRYNRTPLSLILKMFLLDSNASQTLYPPYIISLFQSRLENAANDLDNIGLEIAIDYALLNGVQSVITKPEEAIEVINTVAGSVLSSTIPNAPATASSTNIDDIVNYIITKRSVLRSRIGGQAIDPKNPADVAQVQQEYQALNNAPNNPNLNTNRLAKMTQLAQKVSKGQRLVDSYKKALLNNNTAQNKIKANVGNTPTTDILNQFSDLIEDDYNDFLGPNSSKRFIIYDDQLINSSFTESCDNVTCRVDVSGEIDLIGEGKGNLGNIPMLTAYATDFDLWRQYGYKAEGGISRPYFKNAETQCAPYAVMLLSQNRKRAVRGSITIPGNEYYQLGDVIYLNSRDMLYYVTSVSHSFSYAGTFTTALSLEYGHPLGEYIPSPLDIIGKSLVKAQKQVNTVVSSRQTAGQSLGRHLGSIVFSPGVNISGAESAKIAMLSGDYANFNINEIKNVLAVAANYVTGASAYPMIEVRGFIPKLSDSSTPNEKADISSLIQNEINAVIDVLQHPAGKYDNGHFAKLSSRYTNTALRNGQISKFISPISVAKNLQSDNGVNNSRRQPKEEIFSIIGSDPAFIAYVIEIVLIFKDPAAIST